MRSGRPPIQSSRTPSDAWPVQGGEPVDLERNGRIAQEVGAGKPARIGEVKSIEFLSRGKMSGDDKTHGWSCQIRSKTKLLWPRSRLFAKFVSTRVDKSQPI